MLTMPAVKLKKKKKVNDVVKAEVIIEGFKKKGKKGLVR